MRTRACIQRLLFLSVFGFISCSSDSVSYEVTSEGIDINATVHGRFLTKDSLFLNSLSVVDLNTEHSYKPYLRLWGIGQPAIKSERINIDSYLEGWFLLNNDEIALVFLAEHESAVYIKTKLPPPKQAALISKIEPAESLDKRKTFSLLLGTNTSAELKTLMEKRWRNIDTNK